MSINAWIIALNPENPVARELCDTLAQQGIAAQIRQAVDGRAGMPPLLGREQLSQHKALIYRRAELTSAEVGCYLSHYRLIQEAYEQGLSHICIFEDDVVAEAGLGDLLREIVKLDDTAHLVRLMSLKIRKRKVIQDLTNGYTLTRPLRGALGTQGYVVNRTGMKKILDFGACIYLPIDKLYDNFFLYDLNCFSIEPHAIYELVRSTTVKKAKIKTKKNITFQLLWQSQKITRSIRRRIYMLKNYSAFHPAEKPINNPGKSIRIR